MGNHEQNSPLFYGYFGPPDSELPVDEEESLDEAGAPARGWSVWKYGDVEFFVVNTYADYRRGSRQHRWLEEALGASRARWKIAVGHKPLYSSGKHGGSRSLREHVLPLLLEHGVDLFLVGHDHLYERTWALTDGTGVPGRAVVEIVTAGGGRRGVTWIP